MTRVWSDSKAEGATLLLLLAIADNCHDDGTGAWPAIATLARKTRQSERNTQRLLLKLETLGELKIERETGRNHTNSYTILFPGKGDNLSPFKNGSGAQRVTTRVLKGDNQGTERVTTRVLKGDIAMSPDPSEPSLEPSRSVRLHGIPKTVDEVVTFGQTCQPKVEAERCRSFWAHYEGQARTNPDGQIFWVTSGEAVVTNWKAKLPTWSMEYGNNKNNGSTGAKGFDRSKGTFNEGKSHLYVPKPYNPDRV